MIRKYFRSLVWLAALLPLLSAFGAVASEGKSKSPNIAVEGLTANLFDRGMPAGLLVVGVNLALADAEKANQINAMMPRLRDRYLQVLGQLGASTYRMDRPVNIPQLAQFLQQATDKIIGQDIAKVEISGLFTQRL
jgi:flagellar basal body-associated protein FliL